MTSATPADPFGRAGLPADFSRADRVRLIAECADALVRGELPSVEARLFLGGAIAAWLARGGRVGDLERHYLRIAAPRSSRHTPSELWRRECSSRGTTDGDARDTLDLHPDNDEGSSE